jgi:DNA-binding NarL/FixJ family response regulator
VSVRLLIADDQRVVRDGLAMLVGTLDGIEVVGAVADGAEAVRAADELQPDIVLMDLKMPGLDGAAATAQLAARRPDVRVLVLTTYADDASLLPALRAGARGYLTKDASAEEIEAAIHAVHAGRTVLDPVVQARLVALAVGAPEAPGAPATVEASGNPTGATPAAGPGLPDELTAREAEVLGLIASGLSNAEIAGRLVVSPATVKSHVNRIFGKTGVRDRAQAVRYAFAHGLADPGSAG